MISIFDHNGKARAESILLRAQETLQPRVPELIESLRGLVEQESPSGDITSTTALRDHLAERFARFGEVCIGAGYGGLHPWAVIDVMGNGSVSEPVVVACHLDTVWELGTLDSWPFAVDGGQASGPGCFDMKAGIVMIEQSLALLSEHSGLRRPIRVVLTSDEEIGSPLTRSIVPWVTADAWCALVLEPPLSNGTLKSRRKGSATYRVSVTGREAHSALDPDNGVSAILEAADLVRRLDALPDSAAGDQLNIGTISGGTRVNVVPGHAELVLSVRSMTRERASAIDAGIRGLTPRDSRATVEVSRLTARVPMEMTPGSAELVAFVQAAGRSLGLTIDHGTSPGASDGNLLGEHGLPVLDGLGVRGAGAHARHERIEVRSLVEQTAILTALLSAM